MLVLALLGVAMDIENSNFVSDIDDSDDVGDETNTCMHEGCLIAVKNEDGIHDSHH